MRKKIFALAISIVLITSCAKTSLDTESSLDIPVIQSFLSPGNEAIVRLTTAVPYTTDTSVVVNNNISGMDVYLTTKGETYLLTEMSDSAGYYTDQSGTLLVSENESCQLEFEYKGTQVSSSTPVPLKPQNFESSETTIEVERITETGGGNGGPPDMTEIELSWTDENADFYLIYIQYLEEDYDPINSIVEIEDTTAFTNFSSAPFQDSIYSIRSMQFMYFGKYRIVLSNITEEYAQLYETLSQSSLEGLAEPPTNVVNGKGIFTAFNSDTLFIDVVED
jgi:hypothetical protein